MKKRENRRRECEERWSRAEESTETGAKMQYVMRESGERLLHITQLVLDIGDKGVQGGGRGEGSGSRVLATLHSQEKKRVH